jgi:hypothetical protein
MSFASRPSSIAARLALPGGCLLAVVGCASAEPRIVGPEPATIWSTDTTSSAPPQRPAPMSADEARSIALAHDAAHTCELTARALRVKDRQRGWAVMEQCVRRPDFTDLESLLNPPWIEDMLAHPESDNLAAHVIAVRGGDVASDLRVCRKARLPVFSLKAALAEPDAYKGRLIVMRGSPKTGRMVDGLRSLDIRETRVMAESEWVAAGPRLRAVTETDVRNHEGSNVRPGVQERFRHNEGPTVEVLHNVSVETGLEVLARVAEDAPFLEAGADYVLVLRIDGTREVVEGTTTEEKAVATVVGYYEPENGMFARLGR